MQQKSDNVVSHYVFEAPVRIWHWLTVLCMAVLMVTGYFIGKPLPSVSGEATYLFYMGYIRLIHFSARDDFYRGLADADLLGFCRQSLLTRAFHRASMA
ncbi:Ni/Fe-hydrogenase 1 b-type cytochrome subunit [Escherichia coli]|nr:Ni/Fe-hydrogenase 1 b-type cytochrome subunit [Escherichia coli]